MVVSSVRLSPLLSSQWMTTLSPALAPLTRKPNTGLRETEVAVWPWMTRLPPTSTVIDWM